MDDGLRELAGYDGDGHDEAARQICLAELRPAIERLLQRGMPPGTIVAALAISTMTVMDRKRTH